MSPRLPASISIRARQAFHPFLLRGIERGNDGSGGADRALAEMKIARKTAGTDRAIVSRPMPYFVPPLLSFVAGFIDVITFAALFGLYVAQVTGSFVVVGAQMVENKAASILIIMLAIPVFLFAAVLTVFLCHFLARHGRSLLGWSLMFEGALIAAFYGCALLSPLRDPNGPWTLAASLFALAAMGVQSALVRLLMRGVASTNVMTTNTSLLGIGAAEVLIAWREKRNFSRSRRAADQFQKSLSRLSQPASGHARISGRRRDRRRGLSHRRCARVDRADRLGRGARAVGLWETDLARHYDEIQHPPRRRDQLLAGIGLPDDAGIAKTLPAGNPRRSR